MKGRRPPRRIPEVLDSEEQARMLRELERSDSLATLRNLALIRLLLNAGLRAREARELKIKHLDFKTGRLKVRGKGKKRARRLAERRRPGPAPGLVGPEAVR